MSSTELECATVAALFIVFINGFNQTLSSQLKNQTKVFNTDAIKHLISKPLIDVEDKQANNNNGDLDVNNDDDDDDDDDDTRPRKENKNIIKTKMWPGLNRFLHKTPGTALSIYDTH
uniref:Uncharacterized protein n=1 Tax=Glossina palpalis gambiensis TaxID=67801 RepID=A0A1B0BFG9_9MUSC